MTQPAETSESLIEGIRLGDRRSLARAITFAESTRAEHRVIADAVLEAILPWTGNAVRIGISGPPGVGKSTFIEAFGNHILNKDGVLIRERLRGVIFTDPEAKHWVEQLLHPLIRTAIIERINRSSSQWLLLVAPLLLETDAYEFVDRVLVVDIPEAVQLTRTMLRDNATKDEVSRIMQSQLARGRRLAAADDIVDNTGDTLQLQEQLLRLKQRYEELAHARHQAG